MLFDAASNGVIEPGASLTIAHTCAAGATQLFVALKASLYPDITTNPMTGGSVTYNGVTMTQLGVIQETNSTGLGASFVYLYGLLSPASGTHNIVITPSGSSYMRACAASYTAGNTTTLQEAVTTVSIARLVTETITGAVTVLTANATLIWAASDALASGGSDGGDVNFTYALNGGTQRAHAGNVFLIDHIAVATGSQSMSLTNNANATDWGAVMASVPDVGGGGGGGSLPRGGLGLMGAGG